MSLLDRLNDALEPDFQIEREIARGGMGVVFLARDTSLRCRVAIKVLLPEMATEKAAKQFLDEARTLAKLKHPHIVSVHTVGEADHLSYYVMDYVEGETVAERIRRGPMSREETVKLGRDILDALEAVHGAGAIHRDIKPSNIFLVGRRALLVDFGIAKPPLTSESGYRVIPPGLKMSRTSSGEGTPAYMPPEQAASGEVTPETDLYALGMVLYEALTLRRWESGIRPRDAKWTGVAWSLRRVLSRALARSPEERWPDAVTFRRRLWRIRKPGYWLR